MDFVLAALGFFVLFVLSHVLGYRLGMLRHHIERVIVLCLFWFGVYALWFLWAVTAGACESTALVFTSFILYGLLCLTYLTQSLVLQAGSPSMTIVSLILQNPGQWIDYETLLKNFSDEELILFRMRDLIHSGYVTLKGDTYCLTARGSRVAKLFDSYQRVIMRTMGV